MSEGKAANKCSAYVGNSFKTVGKAFQVKLIERMPRVCKAVKAKGYLMSSLLLYNVDNSKNKEEPLNSSF